MALSPLPDIDQVPRPPARDDEHRVDADVVAVAHEARGEALGGNRDAPQAVVVERKGCGLVRCARLNLDEGDGTAPAGDDVDLSAGNTRPSLENTPAAQAEVPAGERLGAPA